MITCEPRACKERSLPLETLADIICKRGQGENGKSKEFYFISVIYLKTAAISVLVR